ncbi:hypothetical protein GBAR_LOCUS21166, partial [Geodia barretti]
DSGGGRTHQSNLWFWKNSRHSAQHCCRNLLIPEGCGAKYSDKRRAPRSKYLAFLSPIHQPPSIKHLWNVINVCNGALVYGWCGDCSTAVYEMPGPSSTLCLWMLPIILP